ncbi:MAG: translation initiation inhibitor [Armatimonadetes bacterium]|nr:translation initiation inhibitor [Armatimonadota bacterium]
MRCVGELTEYDITLAAQPGETLEQMVGRLAEQLHSADAEMLRLVALAPVGMKDRLDGALADAFGEVDWPVTQLCGVGTVPEGQVLGLQAHALAGAVIDRVEYEGRPIGSMYSDGYAQYVLLGNLFDPDLSKSRYDQCRGTFEFMEQVLDPLGMDFHNIVRTWLFADRILEWYGDLNKARSSFFTDRGVFGRRVPASTGVGIGNPFGAAMVTDVLAMLPAETDGCVAEPTPSPLQCAALDYGSAFSRAMELRVPGSRRLLISGTASIEPGGATVHDTIDEQIDWTMQVVEALLRSRGMDHGDVCRAIVYYANPDWFGKLEEWQTAHDVDLYPATNAQADICRDDLLFEIELDAEIAE